MWKGCPPALEDRELQRWASPDALSRIQRIWNTFPPAPSPAYAIVHLKFWGQRHRGRQVLMHSLILDVRARRLCPFHTVLGLCSGSQGDILDFE
jgi:hypothetical protein